MPVTSSSGGKKEAPWWCTICEVPFKKPQDYQTHIGGYQHNHAANKVGLQETMKSWDKSSGKKRKVEVDHIKETKSSKFQGFAPAGNAANAVKTKFRRIEPESATKATPEKPAEPEAEPKATEKPADKPINKPADDRQNTTREEPVGSEITPQDLAKELFQFIESTKKDKDRLVKAIKDKELETVQV